MVQGSLNKSDRMLTTQELDKVCKDDIWYKMTDYFSRDQKVDHPLWIVIGLHNRQKSIICLLLLSSIKICFSYRKLLAYTKSTSYNANALWPLQLMTKPQATLKAKCLHFHNKLALIVAGLNSEWICLLWSKVTISSKASLTQFPL